MQKNKKKTDKILHNFTGYVILYERKLSELAFVNKSQTERIYI